MRLPRRPEGSDAPQECQREWLLSLKSKGNKYRAARPERQGACYRMKYNEHRGSHVYMYVPNVHTYVHTCVVKTEASRCKHYVHTHILLPACVQYLAAFSMVSRHDFSSERALSRLFTFSCKWRWMSYYGKTYARTDRQYSTYIRTYACTTLCTCGHQLICPSSHQMHCCWHCLTLTCKTSFSTTALRRTHFSFSKQSSSACTLLYATYSTYVRMYVRKYAHTYVSCTCIAQNAHTYTYVQYTSNNGIASHNTTYIRSLT